MTRKTWKMFTRSCMLTPFLEALTKRMYSGSTAEFKLIVCIYARIVDSIFKNPNHAQRQTAQKLLGWITFSKRPMKLQEIQGAASISIPQRTVNFEGRQMPDH